MFSNITLVKLYLQLDPGLGKVLLASTTAGDLLCLRYLIPYSLSCVLASLKPRRNLLSIYLGAEVLEGISLHSVDAELRSRLYYCKSTRH